MDDKRIYAGEHSIKIDDLYRKLT